MNAPLRTYRPPAAGTQNHRSSATTRVAPFAHLHISSFANFPHHSSPITHNSHHSFSAKERDSETNLSYFGSRYYSSDLSIWLSVDPMSGKYPSLSPYVYCADNPVRCVDPNGEEVYIIGEEVAAALEQLQNQTSLKLTINQDGLLTCEGEATSKIDQFVCPSELAKFDFSVNDQKAGLTMIHELAESYFGGELALESKQGSPYGEQQGSTYNEAHWCANQIVIGNKGPVYMTSRYRRNPNYDNSLPISKMNYPIAQGNFEILIGWKRTTNEY